MRGDSIKSENDIVTGVLHCQVKHNTKNAGGFMSGSRSFEKVLSDFKKESNQTFLDNLSSIISNGSYTELEKIFLSLPILLDEETTILYRERLVQIVNAIDTITINLSPNKANGPELFNSKDKEAIEYIQKELIYFFTEELLDGFCNIKPGIKAVLNIKAINISQATLVYLCTLNAISHLTNSMAAICLTHKTEEEHLLASHHALLDRKQIKEFVDQMLHERFLAKLEKLPRKKMLMLVSEELNNNEKKEKTVQFIKNACVKIKELDISRAFDDFSNVIDDVLLKQFIEDYRKYFSSISADNIMTTERSTHAIYLKRSEDSLWLEYFHKLIIKIGIRDLLTNKINISDEVKKLFEINFDISPISLLDAYLSAVDQAIMAKAHNDITQQDSIYYLKYAALCEELNSKRLNWIKEVCEYEVKMQGCELDIISKRYANQKDDKISFRNFASAKLAIVAGLFATAAIAGSAYLAHTFSKEKDLTKERNNLPPFPKH